MIGAAVDRSVTEQLREELEKAIQEGAYGLVNRTTERGAGRVQGLGEALALLNQLIQGSNDEHSARQNPQR
jgi:hypothetical protein